MNRSHRVSASVPAPGRTLTKEADEELALFLEMRKLEKERREHLLHNTSGTEPTLGSKVENAPVFKTASAAPVRKARIDEFLNSDNGKSDYDWLITPPGTPLLTSSDTKSRRSPISSNGTPKAHPTVLKSRLANAPDPSRNLLASRRSSSTSILSSSTMGTQRLSSSGGPTHNGSRPATPTGRPTVPTTSKPTSRPSTPTSRVTLPTKSQAPPLRSSTPVRSSTPSRQLPSAAVKPPASRSATPTRRLPAASTVPINAAPSSRSSSITRPASTVSKSSTPSRPSSPTIKSRPLKPSDIPGFSLDAPPNLRTTLPERHSSASRGRPGAPSNRSSSVEPASNVRSRRQSCSPSRGRVPNGNSHYSGSSVPAVRKLQARGSDDVNPVAIGNRIVERTVNMRRLVPPKQDNQRLNQSYNSGKSSLSPESTGFGRSLSRQSLDMAFRHMDIRRSVPNSLRPLMANVSASSVYSVRSGPARGRTVSVSGSPLAASSPTSSEQSVSNNNLICFEGSEMEDDITSEKEAGAPQLFPSQDDQVLSLFKDEQCR